MSLARTVRESSALSLALVPSSIRLLFDASSFKSSRFFDGFREAFLGFDVGGAALGAGWMANYTAWNCSKCVASGGRCGYNANNTSTSQGSICICPNGVHLESCSRIPGNQKHSLVIILTVGTTALLLFGITCYFMWVRHMRLGKARRLHELRASDDTTGSNKEVIHIPLVDFFSIHKATNNFVATNKLGEGGFGSVYKGRLEDGQYIAVKRLSENSKQSFEELKNEVKLISILTLSSFLVGAFMKMRNYSSMKICMANKSLDKYLFGRIYLGKGSFSHSITMWSNFSLQEQSRINITTNLNMMKSDVNEANLFTHM